MDSPYLDEKPNSLSYIIDRLKGQPMFAHIQLLKGERINQAISLAMIQDIVLLSACNSLVAIISGGCF